MLNNRTLRIHKLTDELNHIIEGCIHRRCSAQEKLYRMFSAKMFGICLRYSSSYEEAKDILHDGFIKIFDKIQQYGERGSFEGWVRKIMINTALERYRKSNVMVTLDQLPEIKEEEDDDDDKLHIPMNELLEYIHKLPNRYRMVFNLYVFEDMTHKEIAESMGITEGTSKSDLSRARNILQNQINNRIKKVANIG